MKHLLKYILLCLILSGCNATYHLKRAKYHEQQAIAKGAKITADTVYKNIEVITPKIEFDTVLRQVNFRDTITVEKDKVITKIKINTVTKEIFVHTECPPDTVTVSVPVTVTKEIRAGMTVWETVILCIFLVLIAFAVGYVVRWVKK